MGAKRSNAGQRLVSRYSSASQPSARWMGHAVSPFDPPLEAFLPQPESLGSAQRNEAHNAGSRMPAELRGSNRRSFPRSASTARRTSRQLENNFQSSASRSTRI